MATVFWLGPREARSPSAARRSARCLHSAAQVKKKSSRASGCRAAIRSASVLQVGRRDAAGGGLGPGSCSSSGSFEASTVFQWCAITARRRSGSSATGTSQSASRTIGGAAGGASGGGAAAAA